MAKHVGRGKRRWSMGFAAVLAASAMAALLSSVGGVGRLDAGGDWSTGLALPSGITSIAAQGALGGVKAVAVPAIPSGSVTPDEDRIDRSWKGDLPLSVTTAPTPRGFSAGSIYEESRLALPPPPTRAPRTAFANSSVPLSALAVGRFIQPADARVMVADLTPRTPAPAAGPGRTLLVSAHYPERRVAGPQQAQAATEMLEAYAPDGGTVGSVVPQSMFDALFVLPPERLPEPETVLGPGDHWWGKLPLPPLVFEPAQQQCLAEAVYFEARSEPYRGQVAVAQVVLNRLKNPAYPKTVCDVVYQNGGKRNACQFSFACDGIPDRITDQASWRRAQTIADDMAYGRVWLADIGTSTHYHATYVRPNWAGVFHKQEQIGKHVFYQTRYGGWS